jgi:hypothetical protein
MHVPALKSALTLGLVVAIGTIPAQAAFDRKQLLQDGEDYVVALHDSYLDASKRLKNSSYPSIPRFFHDRAIEIEQGGELFPAHVSDFPISDASMSARLEWAYEETYDVATSEAADMEPYLVANVQISYEQWLITMHYDAKDPDREQLARGFQRSLDALTETPGLVSANAPMSLTQIRVAAR